MVQSYRCNFNFEWLCETPDEVYIIPFTKIPLNTPTHVTVPVVRTTCPVRSLRGQTLSYKLAQ